MKNVTKWMSFILIVVLMMGILGCNDAGEEATGAETEMMTELDTEAESNSESGSELPSEDFSATIPEISLEEALDAIAVAKEEYLVFEENVGYALCYYASTQENAADFVGEWNRTNVASYFWGNIVISNQDAEGFDVNGEFLFYSYGGSIIDERAHFVTENLAILELYNEFADEEDYEGSGEAYEYIAFERTKKGMNVYVTGRGSELVYFSMNCFAEGEYVQGEPYYTNADILEKTYTEEQLEAIKALIGEELYEDCFVTTTENGVLHEWDAVLEDGTFGKEYHSYIMGVADYHFYRIYIFENGDIYGEIGPDDLFFTNVSGATEVPKYVNVEGTYAGFKEYLQMKAPNMQAGDVVSMSTSFYYYFAIGDAVDNHNGEAVESVYVLKHPAGKLFLLICYDSMSHDFVTKVYDITGNEPMQCSMLSLTEVTGDVVSIDRITLCHTLNILGTYWCDIDYALDENGQLIALSDKYTFEPPESEYWDMILKKELPVIMNGTNTTIASGEKIEIIGTDRECEIYFRVINTGETGTILYETEVDQYGVETYMINGVSEYDYFEWLPYTG